MVWTRCLGLTWSSQWSDLVHGLVHTGLTYVDQYTVGPTNKSIGLTHLDLVQHWSDLPGPGPMLVGPDQTLVRPGPTLVGPGPTLVRPGPTSVGPWSAH